MGGKAAKAAKMPCIWMHNPDSGYQEIPDAVLEITAWTKENIEKIMKFLHFVKKKCKNNERYKIFLSRILRNSRPGSIIRM